MKITQKYMTYNLDKSRLDTQAKKVFIYNSFSHYNMTYYAIVSIVSHALRSTL